MMPLVSVLTPTFERPAFLRLAVQQFLAYTYPRREMIIVDDSRTPATDLPKSPLVKYIRLSERQILGQKHNTAADAAQGDILVHQDDDDVFSPRRLQVQLHSIAMGEADITGFPVNFILGLPEGGFFHFRRGVTFALVGDDHPLLFRFHDSTSAYHRRVLGKIRYTPIPAGEKASFLNRAIEAGFREKLVHNRSEFVYVRHRSNTWRYRDWAVHSKAVRPFWFPEDKLSAYRRASA